MAIAKVILNGEVQMDVTSDTVEANKLLEGETATKNDGTKVTGTFVAPDPVISSLSVIPTENAQTFNEASISGYKPVTVGGIASDYVGSAIPLKSSADLTISGSLFTAPSGYYSESAQSNMGSGFIQIGPSSKFMPNTLNMSVVSSTGYISYILQSSTIDTAGLLMDLSSGYVSADAQYFSFNDITLRSISGTYLPDGMRTLSAQTITPTETAQYISSYRWLTGSQTIAAIASDYVGSAIPRRSNADMYKSAYAVYAPAGYYSSDALRTLLTYEHLAPTILLQSGLGTVTAKHDQTSAITNKGVLMGVNETNATMQLPTISAQTITPGSTVQTIASYQWLTGPQTIEAIPSSYIIPSGTYSVTENGTYDIGSYASVDVSCQTGVDSIYSSIYWRKTLTNEQIISHLNLDSIIPRFAFAEYDTSFSKLEGVDNVTRINAYAFYSCKKLATVDFPQVTDIESNAFYNCSSLSSISFPRASYIDQYAFYSCSRLTTADFPQVSSIGQYAFYSCKSLASISFPQVSYIGQYAFYNCLKLSSVSFPRASFIGQYAFYSCKSLASISFPQASYIGQYAFYSCSRLTTADFPQVMGIAPYTFYTCSNLKTANFPQATYIDQYTFYSCSKLSSISCSQVSSIGQYAFYSCITLSSISCSQASYIGGYAFYDCYNLSSISFPQVSCIGQYAFYYCTSLIAADFPQVSSIGSSAFQYCYELKTANFPQVTYIGAYAFNNCDNLSSINFPLASLIDVSTFAECDRITTANFPQASFVAAYTFYKCHSLGTANFPQASRIGQYAFYDCYYLSSISFPQVSSIADYAFYGCTSLITADFSQVLSIAQCAFYNCTSIITVNIPQVTYIGPYAFYCCSSLSSISCSQASYIGGYAFYDCNKLGTADFQRVSYIDQSAFYSCSKLSSISFPQASYIGGYAFAMPSLYSPSNGVKYSFGLSSVMFPLVESTGNYIFRNRDELHTVSFPRISVINTNTFVSAHGLTSMYLLGSSVPTLRGSMAMAYTPFSTSSYTGNYGSIFVPASLYDSYISATNWSVYSSRIVSLTDEQIAAL